ncbi:MAG: SIS domain-containing protein [Anaerolineales bacterium]|nr:SIS domain-containing protein [Anaerolineales bacterium]
MTKTNSALSYMQIIQQKLQTIVDSQMGKILEASEIVADTVAADGILYTFGTGHSHVICEDVSYRAGGLVPVDAINEDAVTGNHKVVQSEIMERVEGIAGVVIDYYNPKPQDAMLIVSNSGRNAAPIEMAMHANERGMKVIVITSMAHTQGTTSRHSSGKKLYEFADVVFDNGAPRGDCVMELEGMDMPTGAASGITGMFILQSIVVQAIQSLLDRGITPPVFMSGNLDGAQDYNKPLMDKYRGRVKIW